MAINMTEEKPAPHSRSAGYSEEACPGPLNRYAEALWTYAHRAGDSGVILPDGRCDIILRFTRGAIGGVDDVVPIVAGPSTRAHVARLDHHLGYVGIRLRLEYARLYLGAHLAGMTDGVLEGPDAIKIVPRIEACLEPAGSARALSIRLRRVVADLAEAGAPAGRRVRAIFDALHAGGGRLSVADLASITGVDERTIRRDVKDHCGLGPKVLARVLQFRRAVRLFRAGGGNGASDIALEAGYSDQAHMIRSFRDFGGFTPSRMPDVVVTPLPVST